jgi:Transposase DDE domain
LLKQEEKGQQKMPCVVLWMIPKQPNNNTRRMVLRTTLSQIWGNVQYTLFPMQEEEIGPISEKHKKLIAILELIKIEHFVNLHCHNGFFGRPPKDRVPLARAFIAKIVLKLEFTNQLRDHLFSDKQLRRICGWNSSREIPSESKFCRVFEEFANLKLADLAHESLIKDMYEGEIIGHIVKDSTPIIAREKPVRKKKEIKTPKKNGRPKKGEVREKTRIENQQKMSLDEMLADLPKQCDFGKKKSANGHTLVWKGYKLHAAIDDHCIPLAAIVTSASLHDSQAAIPLAKKTDTVSQNFYDLMDSAYNVTGILEHSKSLGHVPLVGHWSKNSTAKAEKAAEDRRRERLNWLPSDEVRYNERKKAERFNALFKDYYGGASIRVRGHTKINCHLMFGVLTLAASLLLSL